MSNEDTKSPAEQLRELRNRALRADHALRCCWTRGDRMELLGYQLADAIQWIVEEGAVLYAGPNLTLVGRAVRSAEVITLEITEANMIGAAWGVVAALTYKDIKSLSEAKPWDILRATNQATAKATKESCYACIKQRIWNQSNPQRGETGYHRSRRHP